MLETRDLVAGYGSFEVLHDVTLSVADKHIVTLLGHNGAGKSTFLKAICGAIPTWRGEMQFNGRPHSPRDAAFSARAGIRYVPQEDNFFPTLTVGENLKLGYYSVALSAQAQEQRMEPVFRLFPVLRERIRANAGVLSGGQRQMLAISMALMTAPQLLLLDEPSAGLAPIAVQRLFEVIGALRSELGTTILLVEQNVNEALRLASEAYVMQEGRIVFRAPCSDREAIIHHLWGLNRVGS